MVHPQPDPHQAGADQPAGAPVDGSGWLAVGGMILMSTVIPVVTFLAGLGRVGPTQSALLSALEPVFTVALAVAFLGEHLAPLQIAGSVLVIGAVILLQWRR